MTLSMFIALVVFLLAVLFVGLAVVLFFLSWLLSADE